MRKSYRSLFWVAIVLVGCTPKNVRGPNPELDKFSVADLKHACQSLGDDAKEIPDKFRGCDSNCISGHEIKIDTAVEGKFEDIASPTRIVFTTGCEAHVDGFGGAFILASTKKQSWKLTGYQVGMVADHCEAIYGNAPKLDALVCVRVDYHQGEKTEDLTWYHYFDGKFVSKAILVLRDNSGEPPIGEHKVLGLHYATWKADGDALIASVGVREGRVTRQQAKVCRDDSKKCVETTKLGPEKIYSLRWKFDGKKFQIAPESVKNLKKIKSKMSGI